MSFLLDLPSEIIIAIVALLPGSAVKAARLTCAKLCNLASLYLFETLYISCHTIDLDVFRLISANPAILRGVRVLVVDDTTISPALMRPEVFYPLSQNELFWPNRRRSYFREEEWNEVGRAWSKEANQVFFDLLTSTYEGHEANRIEQRDRAALMGALPGMTSLQTLVLSNRNADDTPESGAQSMNNSSPLVKLWREVGEGCRERPPFPPRVEWWAPLQDDQFENDEVFDRNYLVDCLSGYLARNGGTRPIIQELGDDDEALDNETVQSYSDEHGARSDDDDDVNELATNPSSNYIQPLDLSSIPASARALRREARGLHVVTDVLRNDMVLSRLKEFRIDASLDTIADVQTPGLSLRMFDFFAPPFVSRLSTAFAATHLTRVELVLSNGREFMDGQDIIDQGQFGLVLASMPSLQHVMIEAHNMGIIGAIPPNATFPHLRTAEFVCGLVSRQEIRIFLRQHRATIEEFHLFYCSLDGPDDEDLSWSDAVQDIMSLQDTGTINLRAATLISGYESIPFTGCGRNKTKSRPRPGEAVYSWTLGVDNDVVNCPTEDLGHIELPALQP